MYSRSRIAGAALAIATVMLLGTAVHAAAQGPFTITKLIVVKKLGQSDGRAMATVGRQTGRIADHAIQAWMVMGGKGALLLLSPEKKGKAYRLRYYQADAAEGRLLGHVPFREAGMVETASAANDSIWGFALSGEDSSTKRPLVIAGDTEAIHARLDDARSPQFTADSLSILQHGQPIAIPIKALLGKEAAGRIYAPPEAWPKTSFLEFLPTGEALSYDSAGEVERGSWVTDGSRFMVTSSAGVDTTWQIPTLQPVMGVPALTRLSVRLLQPLSSRTATQGTNVRAILITPGVFEGALLLPQGSEFDGKVVEAHGVGWGIKHETAAITVHFDSVKLPDGRTLPIQAHIYKVENAQEQVTADGTIEGVRATGTLGHSAENQIAAVAQIDPIAYLFTGTSGPAFSDSLSRRFFTTPARS